LSLRSEPLKRESRGRDKNAPVTRGSARKSASPAYSEIPKFLKTGADWSLIHPDSL